MVDETDNEISDVDVAQAEAEAAAAAAKAAAARAAAAKAAAAAAKAKAKKAKVEDGADEPESEASEPAPAPAPKARKKKRAKKAEEPLVHMHPHSEGLFEVNEQGTTEVAVPIERPFRDGRSMVAIIVLSIVLLVSAGAAAYIATDEQLSQDITCFFEGRVYECKNAAKIAQEARWRELDRKAQNQYGDLTLIYFPADAKVAITQTVFTQDGLNGTPGEGEAKVIPNKSTDLKPGQTIERLPMLDLPIFEATKKETGEVDKVYTYRYDIEITREGYEPRKFSYGQDDWQRVGPGNLTIDWKGVDLVPKPETLKENFRKAMLQLFCALKAKEEKLEGGLTAEALSKVSEEKFEIIRLRNGFKTKMDFDKYYEQLTTGQYGAWWQEQQTEILKSTCDADAQ